jgi:quercetin dioxygenase-like cupin family protein
MSVVEISAPPGDMPPLHVHPVDDEAWVVLEGEVSFFAGSNEPIRVAAGGVAFGPKSVAHTYRVEGDEPARILAICTPGDFAAV